MVPAADEQEVQSSQIDHVAVGLETTVSEVGSEGALSTVGEDDLVVKKEKLVVVVIEALWNL